MTQTVEIKGNEPEHRFLGAESAVTVAGTGLTTIATIKTKGKKTLCFHFAPATQAIDDLNVYARAHPSAELQDFTPSSWTSLPAGGRVRETAVSTTSTGAFVDGDLNSVATTENGYFCMEVDGLDEVQVKASAGADSAAVTANWSLT